MKIHTFVYSLRNVQTKYTYCVLSVFWNVNGYTYPRLFRILVRLNRHRKLRTNHTVPSEYKRL